MGPVLCPGNTGGCVKYAEDLASNGIKGHTIQIDDKWMSNYGDFDFDMKKFPDPKAMSDRIHELGFNVGLWITLWVNTDSKNFEFAKEKGYLLKDAQGNVGIVDWWNGKAGIIDIANPEAKAWFEDNLKRLEQEYNIDGWKFDTRFFDERCVPCPGYTPLDYLGLGAELCDQFDLQGAGVRISWGFQPYGFVTRQVDKSTDWNSLQAAITQNLAISSIGYPFIETDMIGGSLSGSPPTKSVLVRWAQAASLMPLMYSSTSPMGVTNPFTNETNVYDQETVDLYRAAIDEHQRLAPYIWDCVQSTLATGEPIMKPLFFDFPNENATYTITDEWLLRDAVLAAPVVNDSTMRKIYIPSGSWYDVRKK